ncbi:hypothetical protein ACFLXA_04005 [Chloroflexota bacterium]
MGQKVIRLTVLGAMILGAIFSLGVASCKREATIDNGIVSNRGIPAIDTSAPVNIETATFALG